MQEDPIHQSHVYGRIKISRTIFENGHPRNIPVKSFQNLSSGFREEDFLRILHVRIVQEALIHQSHVFGRIKISRIIFEKGHPKGTFLSNYFKIRAEVPEEKIFKELIKKFHFIAMATRVFDGIKFCKQFLKRASDGTFLPSLVWEEKMFNEIVDDAWRTHHHP